MQELLDTLEGLKRRYPLMEEWETENDYSLMNQAIVKLSLVVGTSPFDNSHSHSHSDNNNNNNKKEDNSNDK